MKAMILMFNVPSCQLVRSHIQAESRNSTILQSCIFNFSQHQPEVSSHRHEFITTGSQNLSNQSGMKELFLQRSFTVKRFLALLNENHDDFIQAALSSLKDYTINLQRRIKILRDPACFCSKYYSNSGRIKSYYHSLEIESHG
ncbi:unnamed protein product [Rotaria sp. Silwood1]|nr:unnamed protein product [Rotaria sp. Silwood1]CAF3689564.1 unnamed protein product [Rotaria sp. Silwood1]